MSFNRKIWKECKNYKYKENFINHRRKNLSKANETIKNS